MYSILYHTKAASEHKTKDPVTHNPLQMGIFE